MIQRAAFCSDGVSDGGAGPGLFIRYNRGH